MSRKKKNEQLEYEDLLQTFSLFDFREDYPFVRKFYEREQKLAKVYAKCSKLNKSSSYQRAVEPEQKHVESSDDEATEEEEETEDESTEEDESPKKRPVKIIRKKKPIKQPTPPQDVTKHIFVRADSDAMEQTSKLIEQFTQLPVFHPVSGKVFKDPDGKEEMKSTSLVQRSSFGHGSNTHTLKVLPMDDPVRALSLGDQPLLKVFRTSFRDKEEEEQGKSSDDNIRSNNLFKASFMTIFQCVKLEQFEGLQCYPSGSPVNCTDYTSTVLEFTKISKSALSLTKFDTKLDPLRSALGDRFILATILLFDCNYMLYNTEESKMINYLLPDYVRESSGYIRTCAKTKVALERSNTPSCKLQHNPRDYFGVVLSNVLMRHYFRLRKALLQARKTKTNVEAIEMRFCKMLPLLETHLEEVVSEMFIMRYPHYEVCFQREEVQHMSARHLIAHIYSTSLSEQHQFFDTQEENSNQSMNFIRYFMILASSVLKEYAPPTIQRPDEHSEQPFMENKLTTLDKYLFHKMMKVPLDEHVPPIPQPPPPTGDADPAQKKKRKRCEEEDEQSLDDVSLSVSPSFCQSDLFHDFNARPWASAVTQQHLLAFEAELQQQQEEIEQTYDPKDTLSFLGKRRMGNILVAKASIHAARDWAESIQVSYNKECEVEHLSSFWLLVIIGRLTQMILRNQQGRSKDSDADNIKNKKEKVNNHTYLLTPPLDYDGSFCYFPPRLEYSNEHILNYRPICVYSAELGTLMESRPRLQTTAVRYLEKAEAAKPGRVLISSTHEDAKRIMVPIDSNPFTLQILQSVEEQAAVSKDVSIALTKLCAQEPEKRKVVRKTPKPNKENESPVAEPPVQKKQKTGQSNLVLPLNAAAHCSVQGVKRKVISLPKRDVEKFFEDTQSPQKKQKCQVLQPMDDLGLTNFVETTSSDVYDFGETVQEEQCNVLPLSPFQEPQREQVEEPSDLESLELSPIEVSVCTLLVELLLAKLENKPVPTSPLYVVSSDDYFAAALAHLDDKWKMFYTMQQKDWTVEVNVDMLDSDFFVAHAQDVTRPKGSASIQKAWYKALHALTTNAAEYETKHGWIDSPEIGVVLCNPLLYMSCMWLLRKETFSVSIDIQPNFLEAVLSSFAKYPLSALLFVMCFCGANSDAFCYLSPLLDLSSTPHHLQPIVQWIQKFQK